jgi:myo-inositol 2-dehydrogenase / D-chiro-inositol 1-dehydrogenase
LDSEVTEVYTKGGVLIDPQIGNANDFDTAVTTLHFANGTIGTIDNSRKAVYGYDQRLEVFGSAGAIAAGNQVQHQAVISDSSGIHTAKPLDFFMERYSDSYLLEMQSFIDCLRNNKMPIVTGEDARIAAVIAMAAKRSSIENKPVRLSEID